ncbi:MAG: ATP-dependent zinc metalloprotease FtsH [Planctomycetota bacterium]
MLGLITIVVLVFTRPTEKRDKTTLPQLEQDIEKGYVAELTIYDGNRIEGKYTDNPDHGHPNPDFEIPFTGTGENNPLTSEVQQRWGRLIIDQGGKFATEESSSGIWRQVAGFLPWLILLLVFWFLVLRQMRAASGGGVMQFGRSKARMHFKGKSQVTFDDVAGIEEAKEEVSEIVAFLQSPQKFRRIGARIPRGVLLVGPPGCGKTLLAKAIAGEASVPFFSVSGSDFVEMFVGVGASRVRDLFKQARENAPCIIFLDEIDAVGRRRGTGIGGGHDEREQTLNQILVEMDGFDTDQGIILLAATNRPDVLDPALLRPGRFDRQIVISLPDLKGREKILRIHSRKVKLSSDVEMARVARATPGFSGADLEALVNEAALMTVTAGRERVETQDLEEARDKIRFGRSRRSMYMTERERQRTAFHEAGHAIVTVLNKKADPLHKVTIIPRGMALGSTMSLPEQDRYGATRKELLARLQVAFGGRVAEELACDDISSGAQNDIEQATKTARLMVTKWGMSERVGPISLVEGEEHIFLGREVARKVDHSEATAVLIDQEVKRLVEEALQETRRLLRENLDALHRVADALLTYETLDGDEVEAILRGDDIDEIRRAKERKRRAAKAARAPEEPEIAGETRPRPDEGKEPLEGFAY